MEAAAAGQHRVPVEHRWLGLDRRSLPYAAVALAVWVLWAFVAPAVDAAVPWTDQIRPGDVLRVTDSVTMVPAVGWGLQSGLRTTDRPASGDRSADILLVTDGVRFGIRTGPWAGTPAGLLTQSTAILAAEVGVDQFAVVEGATTIRTGDGDVGVVEGFSAPTSEGLLGALVLAGTGVQIEVVGRPDQLAAHAREIAAMIDSIGVRRPA